MRAANARARLYEDDQVSRHYEKARERALARWARRIVADANATTPADVTELEAAGLSHQEIADATIFVAFRTAFSSVNDALGASPDRELAEAAPEPVRRAVSFGRPVDGARP